MFHTLTGRPPYKIRHYGFDHASSDRVQGLCNDDDTRTRKDQHSTRHEPYVVVAIVFVSAECAVCQSTKWQVNS